MPKIKLPKFIKKIFQMSRAKKIIIITILIIIAIVGYFMFGRGNNSSSIQTDFATRQNLEETVLSTGQVVSGTDLSLSFQSSGVVRQIYVKEGDKVELGQKLAELDQASALASLTSAKGSLAQAQANYDKLINGLSQSETQAYQNAISSADVNLNNAYNGALATLNTGYTTIYSADYLALLIKDRYFPTADRYGAEVIIAKADLDTILQNVKNYLDTVKSNPSKENIDLVISQEITALNNTYNDINIIRTQTDQYFYYDKVTDADKALLDAQKTSITSTLNSLNTLQSSINSYKVALQTAKDNLFAKQIRPRQEDIDSARGLVLSAEGQVQAAQAVVDHSIVSAPASGVVTQIYIKVGEQATPSKEVMILQDIENLHTEADVSEANIASLQVDQIIDYTFDALGPDKHFTGKVLTINPSSTVVSGVVNYKVTGSLDNVPEIKPGMTANMTILVAQKDDVLSIPSTAIINKNSKQYVRVIDDSKKKTYHEVQVQTGLQADGGLVKIISGLNEGEEIVTYIKP